MVKKRAKKNTIVDRFDKFISFFSKTYPDYLLKNIKCINLGRVTKYDRKNHECEVQLLPLQSDNTKVAPLNYVIVPASIYKQDEFNQQISEKLSIPYQNNFKVGCVITVGFFDCDIDNYKGKSNFKVETNRKHSLTDAVILGVVKS